MRQMGYSFRDQNNREVLGTASGQTIPEKTGTRRTGLGKDGNRIGKEESSPPDHQKNPAESLRECRIHVDSCSHKKVSHT